MFLSLSTQTLSLLSALIQSSLQQTCFYPSGVIARNDYACTSLIPSDPGVAVHCCEVGRTCLPNRMCSGNSQDANPMRGTCTDNTWDSPNCPKFCTPYSRLGKMYNCTSTDGIVGQNNDDQFCCVDTGPNCCNNQTLLFVANDWNFAASASVAAMKGMATSMTSTTMSSSSLLTTTSLTSGSSSSSATLSSSISKSAMGTFSVFTVTESMTATPIATIHTTAAESTATTTPDKPIGTKRDWTGIGIGAGVGAAVPLLALIAVGVFLWRRHHRRSREIYELPSRYTSDSASTGISKDASTRMSKHSFLKGHDAAGVVRCYELGSVDGRMELPLKSPRELPGSEGERQRFQSHHPMTMHSNPYQSG